jgi:hypothetical protein
VGAHFSAQGFILVLNELAVIMSPALPTSATLLGFEPEVAQAFQEASNELRSTAKNSPRVRDYQTWMQPTPEMVEEEVNSRVLLNSLAQTIDKISDKEVNVCFQTADPNLIDRVSSFPTLTYNREVGILKLSFSDKTSNYVLIQVTDDMIHEAARQNDSLYNLTDYGAILITEPNFGYES